ncbi:MAG: 6-carboxytetrahydropterin synthase [Sedimentisphaerales bacterium]|nr:6-carboxytetrahydropterin synthase [Sedimentisphaerales bacterium]
MYTVIIETIFDAQHQLTLRDGVKEPLHGHAWMAACAVSTYTVDAMGLAFDFNRLKAMLDEIVAEFKDVQLENTMIFKKVNSSAENVAEYVYNRLEKMLEQNVKLEYVEITEAPHCRARYSK